MRPASSARHRLPEGNRPFHLTTTTSTAPARGVRRVIPDLPPGGVPCVDQQVRARTPVGEGRWLVWEVDARTAHFWLRISFAGGWGTVAEDIPVASGDLACGEPPVVGWMTDDLNDVRTAVGAIPTIYAFETAKASRSALRTLYRRLSEAAEADRPDPE